VKYALWIVSGLLAALFLFAGAMKLISPAEMLAEQSPLPVLFVRFIGLAEVLGALGLILPAALRIKPRLTILAAIELAHVMLGAALLGLAAGDPLAASIPALVGGLATFVAVGRWQQQAPSTAHRLVLQPAA
jgi:DoxX-like family